MKTRSLFTSLVLFFLFTNFLVAQQLTEITGKRFYEHHSSTINGGDDFGNSANGSQSAYDFVNHTYLSSFLDPEANIDMVEHNGPFGNGGDFGFTSGVSTIWNPDIYGNSSTLWMPAPVGFNYSTITNVADIANAFSAVSAGYAVDVVENDKVYLGKIRGTDLYVAMKCYNVTNVSSPTSGPADVYFDFDYKYGTLQTTGLADIVTASITIYPNPTTDFITIVNNSNHSFESAALYSGQGQLVENISLQNTGMTMDIRLLNTGVYFLLLNSETGKTLKYTIVKK